MSRVRPLAFWFTVASLATLASGASFFERGRADPAAPPAAALPQRSSTAHGVSGAPRESASVPLAAFQVSGRVVDPHGDPIADAEVWVEPMDDSGAARTVWLGTDSAGRFVSPRVPPGLHTVTASARGFVTSAVAVDLDADVAELGLELAPAPSPRVLVVDPDGRPVAGAVVVACAESAEVTLRSTADGVVTFGAGALGCAVRAHHPRFSQSPPVRLAGERLVTVRLERGGAIEGVVTDPGGRALFDGELSVSGFEPGESEQALADSPPELTLPLGREFRLSGLAPGVYSLAVYRRARRGDCESVEQLAAAASFEVAPGKVVRGVHIVVDPNDVSPGFGCDST